MWAHQALPSHAQICFVVLLLQAQVELKVLQHLRHHDPEDQHHVIHIQENFMFRNHLCITFELLSLNLYEFIKQNNFQGLSLQLIKRFAQQMLVSLRCEAHNCVRQRSLRVCASKFSDARVLPAVACQVTCLLRKWQLWGLRTSS